MPWQMIIRLNMESATRMCTSTRGRWCQTMPMAEVKVQEVLDKPKGTQEAAHEPAKHHAKEHQQSHHIERRAPGTSAKHRLQGAHGARRNRAGARIAVEPRNADGLRGSAKDLAGSESLHIAVGNTGNQRLDQQPTTTVRLHAIPMHSKHTRIPFAKTTWSPPLRTPYTMAASANASKARRKTKSVAPDTVRPLSICRRFPLRLERRVYHLSVGGAYVLGSALKHIANDLARAVNNQRGGKVHDA